MTATMMTGTWRIEHRDANDIVLGVLIQKPSFELGAGGTAGTPAVDPQVMTTIKRGNMPIIAEDEKLVLLFKPDTARTEASSGNGHTKVYRIPVTYKNLRSGLVTETTFISSDFVSKRPTGASQVWAANQWVVVDEYTVPSQSQLVVGSAIQDPRVDGKIQLQFDIVT